MNDKRIQIDMPALTNFTRMVFVWYSLKLFWYIVVFLAKAAVAVTAVAIAVVLVAWFLTRPPRPYHLDKLDAYLSLPAPVRQMQPEDFFNPLKVEPPGGALQPLPPRED